jgi:membrane protein YqaA with SNARE-associated domain
VCAFFFSILGYFLTPIGVVLMGVLDASLIFFLPLGIDFVVIIMAARKPETFWLYPVLATIGSIAGAALTFWIGRKAGEVGLTRLVNAKRLEHVKARVNRGAAVVAALAVIPPPFPFTPFVLTGGALGMNVWSFFGTLAAVRVLRFGTEAALAARYGRRIIRWMRTPTFETLVGILIALAVIGTIISAIALVRGSKKGPTRGSEAAPLPPRTARAATRPR